MFVRLVTRQNAFDHIQHFVGVAWKKSRMMAKVTNMYRTVSYIRHIYMFGSHQHIKQLLFPPLITHITTTSSSFTPPPPKKNNQFPVRKDTIALWHWNRKVKIRANSH